MILRILNTLKNTIETSGPAVIGLELGSEEKIDSIMFRMDNLRFQWEYLNDNHDLFQLLV